MTQKNTQLRLVRSNAQTACNVLYGYPEELKLLVTTGKDVGEASKVSRGLLQSGVDVATEKTELTAREMLAPARHGGTEFEICVDLRCDVSDASKILALRDCLSWSALQVVRQLNNTARNNAVLWYSGTFSAWITAQFHVLTTLRKNIEGNDMPSSEVFMSLLKTKQPDPGNGPIADFYDTTDLNSNGYQGLKRLAGKCGVKINWICDAENGYALKGLLYADRSGKESQIGLASTNVGQLAQQFVNSNRNVYMDCYFTSYSTVKHLFEQDLTAIGTVFAHRRDVLAC
ncbi:hypothetical protein T05_15929 [Trichinella murrelli]|uniref:PiggyBac transposable element-derived protein domain-containing protein n=1 Tax=Trichinella murrelli TaxID=144512 RepID=A0A0V0TIF1_9BILA|nr:hypothetical protein T05_15929 [Trichinella murrelli]